MRDTMLELKNCPNCGGMAMFMTKRKNHNYKFWFECSDCWTETHKYYTAEEAAEEWNNLKKEVYDA
jgi:hypothetical protein